MRVTWVNAKDYRRKEWTRSISAIWREKQIRIILSIVTTQQTTSWTIILSSLRKWISSLLITKLIIRLVRTLILKQADYLIYHNNLKKNVIMQVAIVPNGIMNSMTLNPNRTLSKECLLNQKGLQIIVIFLSERDKNNNS